MNWKLRANNALARFTGYQLVKPGTHGNPPWKKEWKRAARAKAAKHPKPVDYDEAALETMSEVRAWTMIPKEKLYALILAVRYVSRHQIPGAIVECGVGRGGSMQAIAKTLLSIGDKDRELYLFDTFEGMPPPTEEDRRFDDRPAAELLSESGASSHLRAVTTLEDVQVVMAQTGYSLDRVHYVPGMVEETVPGSAPEQIAILRLDTDWYASTRHELEHLYDRLSPGGVLLIGDYGWWKGSRQAVDEFLERTEARLLLLKMGTGRVAVKP